MKTINVILIIFAFLAFWFWSVIVVSYFTSADITVVDKYTIICDSTGELIHLNDYQVNGLWWTMLTIGEWFEGLLR